MNPIDTYTGSSFNEDLCELLLCEISVEFNLNPLNKSKKGKTNRLKPLEQITFLLFCITLDLERVYKQWTGDELANEGILDLSSRRCFFCFCDFETLGLACQPYNVGMWRRA